MTQTLRQVSTLNVRTGDLCVLGILKGNKFERRNVKWGQKVPAFETTQIHLAAETCIQSALGLTTLWGLHKIRVLLSIVPRFPKDHCFLQDSQAWPICPSGKSNMYTKMSTEQWWNDKERAKTKSGRKGCSSASVKTINLTGTDLELNPGLLRERPATNCSAEQTELELHLQIQSVPRSKLYISLMKTSQCCIGK
jgi:hypothetical protein